MCACDRPQASVVHKQSLPWTLAFQLVMIEPRHRTPECATALTGALLIYGDRSLFTTRASPTSQLWTGTPLQLVRQ